MGYAGLVAIVGGRRDAIGTPAPPVVRIIAAACRLLGILGLLAALAAAAVNLDRWAAGVALVSLANAVLLILVAHHLRMGRAWARKLATFLSAAWALVLLVVLLFFGPVRGAAHAPEQFALLATLMTIVGLPCWLLRTAPVSWWFSTRYSERLEARDR
jgi:hypothetical protein